MKTDADARVIGGFGDGHAGRALDARHYGGSLVAPALTPGKFKDATAAADVPCNGCTLCCRTLIVPLADEEYEQYDWAWIVKRNEDGTMQRLGRALKKRANGDCVYLSEGGCSIHGRAPHVCQTFDCRELWRKSDRNGRRAAIASGKISRELFERGREMSKLSS